jgi:hypothetical protein
MLVVQTAAATPDFFDLDGWVVEVDDRVGSLYYKLDRLAFAFENVLIIARHSAAAGRGRYLPAGLMVDRTWASAVGAIPHAVYLPASGPAWRISSLT